MYKSGDIYLMISVISIMCQVQKEHKFEWGCFVLVLEGGEFGALFWKISVSQVFSGSVWGLWKISEEELSWAESLGQRSGKIWDFCWKFGPKGGGFEFRDRGLSVSGFFFLILFLY